MLRERLQRVPAVLVDVLLAVALAIAITVTMPLTQDPANQGRPDALAYGLGLTIAALTLFRRRWPLGVLLASTATLQVYYQMDYPGIQPALPLSVRWPQPLRRAILGGRSGSPHGSSSRR